jgi:hypothetical protein
MFDRHEMARDGGDIIIRGYQRQNLVIACIKGAELRYIEAELSMTVTDQCAFVNHNIKVFLEVFWNKFSRGDFDTMGKLYPHVWIDGEDLRPFRTRLSCPIVRSDMCT